MSYARLVRLLQRKETTLGILIIEDDPRYCTLEDQWLNNETGISCIPAGRYTCKRVLSPKFGDTFEIVNVPGRSHILFHAGNTNLDTRGCVILGSSFGEVAGLPAVLGSRDAYHRFIKRLHNVDVFTLDIVDSTEL